MLDWLLQTDCFLTRGSCGDWGNGIALTYRVANVGTAVAYYAIPAVLFYLWRRKREVLPEGYILLCFCAFIFLCGSTHILDFLAFYWPAYRFFTLVEVTTAVVSVATAAILPSAVKHILSLPTPGDYQKALDQAVVALEEKKLESKKLEDQCAMQLLRIEAMENDLKHLSWRIEIREEVGRLVNNLSAMKQEATP